MPTATNNLDTDDFMDPKNLAQLADDTSIYAEKDHNMKEKFKNTFEYSKTKYQSANIKKTLYCNFSDKPSYEPLKINDEITINSVDDKKGYKYIGTSFYPTSDVQEIIKKNINKRKVHLAKFYAWLDVNETTPIDNKLMVLDNCVFGAMLYGSECWGDITFLEKELLTIEMKALKAILKVKKGTTNDLIYHELRRPSIVSKIRDQQKKFFEKISQLGEDEAIVVSIMKLCTNTNIMKYYRNLPDNNSKTDVEQREERIRNSTI